MCGIYFDYSIKKKVFKKSLFTFTRSQVNIFTLLVLSDQKLKSQFRITLKREKRCYCDNLEAETSECKVCFPVQFSCSTKPIKHYLNIKSAVRFNWFTDLYFQHIILYITIIMKICHFTFVLLNYQFSLQSVRK